MMTKPPYRGQFQPWAPGRCLVEVKPKTSHPTVYDVHNKDNKIYGLYAWNFKMSIGKHPSLTHSDIQNKLYNSSLLVNNWLLLRMLHKGG